MIKRFLIAWIVVFVVWMIGGFVVHAVLLQADYASLPNLFRSDADSQHYFVWMILAHILMAGAFSWIYLRGVEAKPWFAQGVRFGLAVALLAVVPVYMMYYAVQPMPGMLVVKQIIFDSIVMLVLGVVVAFLQRDKSTG